MTMTKGERDDLGRVIDRIFAVGPGDAMREAETAAGFYPVFPGEVPWLSPLDWPEDIVISVSRTHVRIVAFYALRPRCGAFSRLIDRIIDAGLTPVVIAPVGETMPAIMKRWGWKRRIRGDGWFAEDRWQPTRAWMAARPIEAKHRTEYP